MSKEFRDQLEQNSLVKAQAVTSQAEEMAQLAHIRKVYSDLYKLQALYDNEMYEQTFKDPKFLKAKKQLAILQEQQLNGGIKTSDLYGYWITINPPYEDKDPYEVATDILKRTQKLVKSKGVFQASWVIEQTGETEEELGKHPHIHLLIQRNITNQMGEPSRLKAHIERHLQKIGNCNKIKPCHVDNVDGRLKYLLGQKSDSSKSKMLQMDKIFREKLKAKPIYYKDAL